MSRLPDPTIKLTGKTKEVFDKLSIHRPQIDGMYRTMLNHPELTEQVSNLGTYLRFESTLPGDIREFAILYTARKLKAEYEWVKHVPPAIEAGLPQAIINAILNGKSFPEPYKSVSLAVDHLLELSSIPEELQNELIRKIQIKGLMEITIMAGFYRMIAGLLNAFDVPLPKDTLSPFQSQN